MSNKTKINPAKVNLLPTLGMLMMSLASVAGFFEFSDHQTSNLARNTILPSQANYVTEPIFDEESNQINKEKEEVAPEYVSYSEVQRTAPRASKY